jgi:hypothetical protein
MQTIDTLWHGENLKEDRAMKRITVLFVMIAFAVPAIAEVEITAATGPGPKDVTVGFVASGEGQLVRAIALKVNVDDFETIIADINCVNADYGIYPGSISIDSSGNVTDWGTCAGAGLGSNSVATEQGTAYAEGDPAPAQSGELFIITLGGCTRDTNGEVTVSITEDALGGGVVLEDPDVAATVILPSPVTVSGIPTDCGGQPPCYCWGDVTGATGTPDGLVSTSDMGAMLALLGAAGPPYSVPIPPGEEWYCMDITGPSGVPDGIISTADMAALLSYLGGIGPPYVGFCMQITPP